MSETLVFVYGTLKRGMSNHRWLRGQRFVDESRTLPSYRMYDLGGYPGLVKTQQNKGLAIEGEVWAVDEPGLRRLHLLEGVAEKEYSFETICLEAPWVDGKVNGYLYLRSVEGRKELGSCWQES
jgi:gamma-glutamylaminecyclotransferase